MHTCIDEFERRDSPCADGHVEPRIRQKQGLTWWPRELLRPPLGTVPSDSHCLPHESGIVITLRAGYVRTAEAGGTQRGQVRIITVALLCSASVATHVVGFASLCQSIGCASFKASCNVSPIWKASTEPESLVNFERHMHVAAEKVKTGVVTERNSASLGQRSEMMAIRKYLITSSLSDTRGP